MNALLRPALYGSFHFIWPVSPGVEFAPRARAADPGVAGTAAHDVVGPLCETGDFLATDRVLPASIKRGDLLAVFTAGAYGMSMASTYNSHLLPAEVLVSGSTAELIRPRENLVSLYHAELKTTQLLAEGVPA
jgi:diaminopimelate decarboxylase